MRCLRKFQWVKLFRDKLPEGKGVLGFWAKLAACAAYRNRTSLYCGFENEVKEDGYQNGKHANQKDALARELAFYRNLLRIAEGVAKPGDERDDRHRRAHSKVGDHFTVILKIKGDQAVTNGKGNDQSLPDHVSLGNKNKRADANQGYHKR